MILVDFSGLTSIVLHSLHKYDEITEDTLQFAVLNNLRKLNKRFRRRYGRLYICCDDKRSNYWRNDIFPYYKWKRTQAIRDDSIPWDTFYSTVKKLKEDIQSFLPFKVLQIDRLEADDIIGIICQSVIEETVIISRDKDFLQLQKNKLVFQFDTVKNKYLSTNSPILDLKEKIITGDSGDGICNINSTYSSFKDGVRQKPMTKKLIHNFLNTDPNNYSEFNRDRFKLNEQLIDLSKSPKEYKNKIYDSLRIKKTHSLQAMLDYFNKINKDEFINIVNDFRFLKKSTPKHTQTNTLDI